MGHPWSYSVSQIPIKISDSLNELSDGFLTAFHKASCGWGWGQGEERWLPVEGGLAPVPGVTDSTLLSVRCSLGALTHY